jgi:group I intron endonuclease
MPILPIGEVDWTVYKISNPQGRIYVGITINPELRKKNYANLECKNQKVLYNSIRKYGWDKHNWEIIDTFKSDINYAHGKEMFWIRSNMCCTSIYPEFKGMNITIGGGGNIGVKMTQEQKIKISIRNSGKVRTPEMREKISKAKIGKPSYIRTAETIEKLIKSRTGQKHIHDTKDKLSAYRKTTTGTFGGWKQTEERKKQIGLSKIGNKNSLGKKRSLDVIERAAEKKRKPILQYNIDGVFIKEYLSIKDAIIHCNVSRSTIQYSLYNKTNKPKFFIFKYK